MHLFSKKPKKGQDTSALDSILASSSTDERRRAVRIETTDISVTVDGDGKESIPAKTLDMSTLGIGLELKAEPADKILTLTFHAPELLKGMQISAQKKHVEKVTGPDGATRYQVGCEFVFSASDQQNRLLRWLASHLQGKVTVPPVSKGKEAPFNALFYSELNENFEIRFPCDQNEFEQALELIGRLTLHHALIQTKFFTVIHKKTVVGLIPFIADTQAFRLLSDEIFPEHMSSLRSSGRRIAEISCPYFKEDFVYLKNPSLSHLRKLRILFSIYPYVFVYAKNFANLTDLVSLVPPHMEEFFRLWFFKELGPEAKVLDKKTGQIRQGFRLMWLNLAEHLQDPAAELRPELSSALARLAHSSSFISAFQNSYFPDPELFKKWFQTKNPLLDHLSQDQAAYFDFLIHR